MSCLVGAMSLIEDKYKKRWQPKTWQDSTHFSPPSAFWDAFLAKLCKARRNGKHPLEKIDRLGWSHERSVCQPTMTSTTFMITIIKRRLRRTRSWNWNLCKTRLLSHGRQSSDQGWRQAHQSSLVNFFDAWTFNFSITTFNTNAQHIASSSTSRYLHISR